VTVAPPAIKSERSNHLHGVSDINSERVVEVGRVLTPLVHTTQVGERLMVGAGYIGARASRNADALFVITAALPHLSSSYALLVLSVVLSRLFDCRPGESKSALLQSHQRGGVPEANSYSLWVAEDRRLPLASLTAVVCYARRVVTYWQAHNIGCPSIRSVSYDGR